MFYFGEFIGPRTEQELKLIAQEEAKYRKKVEHREFVIKERPNKMLEKTEQIIEEYIAFLKTKFNVDDLKVVGNCLKLINFQDTEIDLKPKLETCMSFSDDEELELLYSGFYDKLRCRLIGEFGLTKEYTILV